MATARELNFSAEELSAARSGREVYEEYMRTRVVEQKRANLPEVPDDRSEAEKRLSIWTGSLDAIPEPRWVLPQFITERSVTLISGDSQSGKSFLMIDWANLLAAPGPGWKWLGHWERSKQYRVGYLVGEGATGLRSRVSAWMQHRDINDPPAVSWVLNPPYFIEPKAQESDQAMLLQWVESEGVEVLFVDTLARMFAGNENQQADMNQFVNFVGDLQNLGCAVVIAHHKNKSGGMRGSTALEAAADTIIDIKGFHHTSKGESYGKLLRVEMSNYKQKDGISFGFLELGVKRYEVAESQGESLVLDWDSSVGEKETEQATKHATKIAETEQRIKDEIVAVLAEYGGDNSRGLVAKVKGGTAKILEMRNALVAEGVVEMRGDNYFLKE